MSNHSDFSSHGYQVTKELGRNREAGRITYLAKRSSLTPLDNEGIGEELVVIKEFRFAMGSADWSGFKAYQREIELLQQLDHPRIPRYLDSFETASGFCLVQEYKNAPSLAERRSFTPEEIDRIAVSVLEILVYLQKRTPPIIHRDIKPENILVDKKLNAYLIDFGFARIRSREMALSSVAAGTVGFMPPEEQFGRSLTEASDLYSLGATLICLLTGTRSVNVGKLIDDNYRFEFKKLVTKINPRFVAWLTKMVEPNLKNRYANATVALAALKPIDVVGDASWRETLFRSVNLTRKPAVVAGLATLGVVSIFGANLIISQLSATSRINDIVSRLQRTNSCEKCDLRGVNLGGANLVGANLGGANLVGANLRGAKLVGANLGGANLGGANLVGANLRGAKLVGANLGDANLGGSYLEGAKLGGANLGSANLVGSQLGDANLVGAYLARANLGGASLHANLESANLAGANLGSAYLGGANLESANLGGAYLVGANLKGANLEGANLARANLARANLARANLDGANLKGAIMPDNTEHP